QARACDGEWGVAARLSGGRRGGRALLGWRADFKYTATMGDDWRQGTSRYAGIPSRSMELARRSACRPCRSDYAPEGNPILEPDPLQHRYLQTPADRAPHPRRSPRQGAGGVARQRRGPFVEIVCRPEGLQRGASDLPVEELRE